LRSRNEIGGGCPFAQSKTRAQSQYS